MGSQVDTSDRVIISNYPTTRFVLKMAAFTPAAYTQVHFRLHVDCFIEANNMNPDHTT